MNTKEIVEKYLKDVKSEIKLSFDDLKNIELIGLDIAERTQKETAKDIFEVIKIIVERELCEYCDKVIEGEVARIYCSLCSKIWNILDTFEREEKKWLESEVKK